MKFYKNKRPISIYIHVPFCLSKCFYCDFHSFGNKLGYMDDYFSALHKELQFYLNLIRQGYYINTIFFGGGTPSMVENKYIEDLLSMIKHKVELAESCEISIESNPETLSFEKLLEYKKMGFNRLSMGLQVSQDDLLKKIGRVHDYATFLKGYKDARRAGFNNINVDLIFGIPGQSMDDWKDSVNKLIELKAEHVSCYSLKIEEGTVFNKKIENGEMEYPDDELDREMYYYAIKELKNFGYIHYEISNFSLKGYECRHNLTYWDTSDYIGVGLAAHSYLEGIRFSNIVSLNDYISLINKLSLPINNYESINIKESINEFIMLGFRRISGISILEFERKFGVSLVDIYKKKIDKLVKENLLECKNGKMCLTKKGLDYGNVVFMEFINE